MTKITEEQKELMAKYLAEGMTILDVSKKLGISTTSVRYWTGEREIMIKREQERVNKMTPEKKQERYNKHKEYFRGYFYDRYHNDPEFREKHKARCRKK